MSNVNEIFSDRLKRARIMRGLSMESLCEKMNGIVSKQTISKYEKGQNLPGSQVLISLALALDVKPDYFFKPSQYSISNVEFRKKSKLSPKKIESIKEVIRDKVERYLELEEICNLGSTFDNPANDIVVSDSEMVYEVVKKIRSEWKLGEDGISNVTEFLESKNIKVVEIDEDKSFDGLSGIVNNDEHIPFIVLNKTYDSERKRFTALHELGHIIMNIPADVDSKVVEKLCHLFASEMLISAEILKDILGEKRTDISLMELIAIQKSYGISIDALMYKAKELGIIADARYVHYCIYKNKNKSFKQTVEAVRYKVIEMSNRFERLVYRALASDVISYSKAAVLLNKSIEDVRNNVALV